MFSASSHNRASKLKNIKGAVAKFGNPIGMLSHIPLTEAWRFFIGGIDQDWDIRFKECLQAAKFEFSKEHLAMSVKDFVKTTPLLLYPASDGSVKTSAWSTLLSEFFDVKAENCEISLAELLSKRAAWRIYEKREPGFLTAMCKAFHYAAKSNEPLSIAFIQKLNKLALTNVKNTAQEKSNQEAGEVRNNRQMSFPITSENSTPDGLRELKQRMEILGADYLSFGLGKLPPDHIPLKLYQFADGEDYFLEVIAAAALNSLQQENFQQEVHIVSIFDLPNIKNQIELQLQKLINTYQNEMHQAEKDAEITRIKLDAMREAKLLYPSVNGQPHPLIKKIEDKLDYMDEEKLLIIIRFIRDCKQLHAFQDGNGRTFCIILLNSLLMKNGFPPVVLKNPNQFNGYDEDALVDEVINGMQNTFKLMQENPSLFNTRTDAVISNCSGAEREYFLKMLESLTTLFKTTHKQEEKKLDQPLAGLPPLKSAKPK